MIFPSRKRIGKQADPIHEVSLSSACCSSGDLRSATSEESLHPSSVTLTWAFSGKRLWNRSYAAASRRARNRPPSSAFAGSRCAAEEVRPAGCPLRLGKKEVGELAVPPTAFDPQVPAPELVSHRHHDGTLVGATIETVLRFADGSERSGIDRYEDELEFPRWTSIHASSSPRRPGCTDPASTDSKPLSV